MKSLQRQLETIRDILNATSAYGRVYHYERPKEKPQSFIVWQEAGEADSTDSDNRKQEQQINGTIDLFTKEEYDHLVDEVQEALNSAENIGWRLSSVQYEDETEYIHYEWEFNIG